MVSLMIPHLRQSSLGEYDYVHVFADNQKLLEELVKV
jgi:hypothetical protein